MRPTGRWTLFVEDGCWTVETGDLRCERCDTDLAAIARCLSHLDGQRLRAVRVSGEDPSLVLEFDLAGSLRIGWNVDIEGNDQWRFHGEDDRIMAYVAPDRIVMETTVGIAGEQHSP